MKSKQVMKIPTEHGKLAVRVDDAQVGKTQHGDEIVELPCSLLWDDEHGKGGQNFRIQYRREENGRYAKHGIKITEGASVGGNMKERLQTVVAEVGDKLAKALEKSNIQEFDRL